MDLPRVSLTIGQLAKKSGVGVETVRYYERQKLIPEPPRRESGYRQYPPETVNRIGFIRKAQGLGFSLKEIDELLALRTNSTDQCAEILARAQGKIADIAQRIASLERVKHALEQLASSCSSSGTSGDCPFLDALEIEP